MCCFVLYEAVHPLIRRLVEFLPVRTAWVLLFVLFFFFLVDVVSMVATVLGLNRKWKYAQKITADMRKVSDRIGREVYQRTRELDEKRQALAKEETAKRIEERIEKRRTRLVERWLAFSEKRMLNAFPHLLREKEDEKTNAEGK